MQLRHREDVTTPGYRPAILELPLPYTLNHYVHFKGQPLDPKDLAFATRTLDHYRGTSLPAFAVIPDERQSL